MANIKFSRKVFEKEIGKLNEEMQQKIALFGTTLENFNDDEIELEIFPDRPDLLSYQGFKRGFLGYLGKKNGLKEYKVHAPEKDFEVKVDSSVKDVRPYTTCAIIKGLKLDDNKIKELIDLQEKIHTTLGRKRKKLAIGIYPLEKIKLPIEYKALEPDKIKFIPLESPKEMSGLQILQKHPTGKEYAHLLAGKAKFPIFIDAAQNILSMPPIINSELTGRITKTTKDVFIECSGFDQETLNKCLNIIVTTLGDMNGKIYQMKVKDKITPDLSTQKSKISLENVNKTLGLNLKEKEMQELLQKMGHSYKNGLVESPSWRTDILHEMDLIEDIAIAYGYDNFEPEIPQISTIGEENKEEIIKRKISELLIGLNMIETSNYHLTKTQDQFTKMGIGEKQEKGAVHVEESKTEYDLLRKDLTHYTLKIFSENVDAEYPQKTFELGRVMPLNNQGDIVEKEKLSIGVTPGNFTDTKQILDYLGTSLGIELTIKEQDKSDTHFIDGRSADILLDEKPIGTIGEIHPKILNNWRIKMPVALLEIDLTEIFNKF
ncbi:MAG: phenylalanine--tRNA ligase subunit beta [Nanoarchaeota archaeon]|jgi:phenylalanyl-tRNA synthetase beta chain|nr:phenylalanine--tRNA ligase subunit beta [Nanoarchaeota archaeon]